jgi:hypothetical protein
MWKYKCYMCNASADDYYCENCKRIQKIIELYSVEVVRKSLDKVFIRETTPIEKRIEVLANKNLTRSKADKKPN